MSAEERTAEEVAKLRRLIVGIVVGIVVGVIVLTTVNSEIDRQCQQEGNEPTGGLIHGCQEDFTP